MRCEEDPGVEAQFVSFLDDLLKGDTKRFCSHDANQQSSSKKKRKAMK
jgi:hypothetical protein